MAEGRGAFRTFPVGVTSRPFRSTIDKSGESVEHRLMFSFFRVMIGTDVPGFH